MSAANYVMAESRALQTLDEYSVADAPVPVADIAARMGLGVLEGGFPNDEIAGLLDVSAGQIIVNKGHSPKRQLFTIAHEIGHFVLHRDLLLSNPDLGVVYRHPIGGESDPMEQEANCFAANMLVPEFLLQRYYSGQSIEEAAAIFGVSAEVMRYRLQSTRRM